MKIAIVHDHLTQEGGAEKVLKVMADLWPEALIFTLIYNQELMGRMFPPERVRTSFLQRMPGGVKKYQWYLPLMPAATENHNLRGFDVVISSSSAFAHGVITHPGTLSIVYCHTPTRYLWSDSQAYVSGLRYPKTIKRFLPYVFSCLRQWDQVAALRPDVFVANSHFVSQRIRKYYKRDSSVIFPPVEIERFSISNNPKTYYLTGGRFVPYKRFDLTIQAFNRLRLPLKIFGDGPAFRELRALAGPSIEFVGRQDGPALAKLYAESIAFIHPQVEDFGITAIESMASGRPVIAFGAGGALETIVPGVTGEYFDEQSWEALANTVARFKHENYDPRAVRQQAERFATKNFTQQLSALIEGELANRKK